jgi:hypothetical protein
MNEILFLDTQLEEADMSDEPTARPKLEVVAPTPEELDEIEAWERAAIAARGNNSPEAA